VRTGETGALGYRSPLWKQGAPGQGRLRLHRRFDPGHHLHQRLRRPDIVAIDKGPLDHRLFLAVVVIGVLAGSAEEIFFRGYMQTRLGQRLRPSLAVLVTSVAFGLLHLEWIHAVLAFALGLYLGYITELAGSALPALTCHVINNALFTVLTAASGTVEAAGPNAVLAVASALVFAGCIAWLRRARSTL